MKEKVIAATIAVIFIAALILQLGFVVYYTSCNGNSGKSSDTEMEDGIVYLTDFSVMYTSEEESPYGEVDESTLAEEKNGTVQSYYLVMQFDMQTASNISGMEYLTVELTVLDADIVDTTIDYTNTSSTTEITSDGQTTITAKYSLPEKAQDVKNVQLVVELKPSNTGATDIVYDFSSDGKTVTGYGQTDCTYEFTGSTVSISNTSLSYTLNSSGTGYYVTGTGTKGESKNLIIRSYWDDLPVNGIDEEAFYNATYITDIFIPDTVTYIGRNAFTNTGYYNNKSNWEDGVLYIDNYLIEAKDNNSSSYTVKDGTEVIASYAFSENSSLEEVNFPDSLAYINIYAFYECTALAGVTIPDTLLCIDNYAFAYCSGITELLIPDSVETLGSYAFYYCTALTNVTLGKNITYIGSRAFYYCTALTEINYNVISVETLYNTGTTIIGMTVHVSPVFGDSTGSKGGGIKLTIGSEVTEIPEAMFYECQYITSLEFEKNSQCKVIGASAFYYCLSLSSVTIGGNVDSIGRYAFYKCTALKSITIGSGVKTIDDYAFYNCTALTNVTIGSSVEKIGNYVFKDCKALTSAKFENTSGWWVSTSSSATSGTSVTVTSASKNATYLTSTYYNYYWYRSDS